MNFFKNSRTYSFGLMLAIVGILISLVQAGALTHKQSPGFNQADPAEPSAEAVKTDRPENKAGKEASLTALTAQETKLIAADGGDSDKFGQGVAISGNTAIVGSPSATVGGNRKGAAYIYIQSGGIWTLQQRITASDGVTGGGFGQSVAISGDTAVVGLGSVDGQFITGAVYVFIRTGTVWTQQQKLTASDTTENQFSSSVAISNNTMVVGAPKADIMQIQGAFRGAAYIYTRSGGIWTEQQKIFASDHAPSRKFGNAVAISGSTVVVGETPNTANSSRLAAAYFFILNGGTWTQEQEITASDGTIGDGFSWSVAINGDTAIIGALPENNLGSAYVLTRSGTTWTQQQKLIPSDGATNKGFGNSVSMSGNAAIIGASADNIGQGSAYIFTGTGTTWTQQQKLIPSDRATNGRANDRFGNSVGISVNTAIVGSYLADIGANVDQGTAYIFTDLNATPTPTVQFGSATFSVNEGGGSATINVSRTGDTSGTSTVDYATADGTASQKSKYIVTSGTLSFAPGDITKSFSVPIIDEAYVEGDKTVNLSLSNPTGATLGAPSAAVLTIIDNDTVPPTTNPYDDAGYFVREQYLDFLNREPDAAGFNYWKGQITQCGSDAACIRAKRIDVSNAFFFELEFQQTGSYVYRVYRAAFGNNQPFPNPDTSNDTERKKLPSYAVFASDRARVVGGANLAQGQQNLANLFVQRPEFLAKYPANLDGPSFIDAVLNTIKNDLGVDLTPQRGALITLFNSGGRGAVVYRLADDNMQTNPIANAGLIDAEYNRAFVATQYFGYLRRDSDMGGFSFWLGQVNSAPLRDVAKQHSMVCSFITATEYQQRFSSVVTHTNDECPH